MNASERPASVFRFGPFTVDVGARELRCGSSRIELSARQFDLLAYLVERAGTVVSKDTLLAEVWAGISVEENTLVQTVSALRRQLRKASAGDYIITVPGRGYQLATLPTPDALAQHTPAARSRSWILAGALVGTAMVFVLNRFIPMHALHVAEERCVAVIPFQTVGGSPQAGAVLAEALTGELVSNGRSRIRPTFASAAIGPAEGIRALGQRLKVDRIVSGSMHVQRDGTSRIHVELVDVDKEAAIWSATFDRLSDSVPRELVLREIATAVSARLSR